MASTLTNLVYHNVSCSGEMSPSRPVAAKRLRNEALGFNPRRRGTEYAIALKGRRMCSTRRRLA